MRIFVLLLASVLLCADRAGAADKLPPVFANEGARLPPKGMPIVGLRVDTQPKFISGDAPTYPMMRLRQRGHAVIGFTVDPSGRTRDVQVVKASDRDFAKRAIAAVQKWRFRPGIKNGRPVSCYIEAPFYFEPR